MTKLQCSWDQPDDRRLLITTKQWTEDEIKEDDFKAYIAETDEDEDEDEDVQDKEKGVQDKDEKKKIKLEKKQKKVLWSGWIHVLCELVYCWIHVLCEVLKCCCWIHELCELMFDIFLGVMTVSWNQRKV